MLVKTVSILGGPRLRTAIVAIASLALMSAGRRASALLLVVGVGGAGLLNTCVKWVVGRRRPRRRFWERRGKRDSFPSGHSSGTVSLVGVLAYLLWHLTARRVAAGAIAVSGAGVAALVGLSRVELRKHHVGDVLGGYALGIGWLLLTLRMLGPRLAQESHRVAGRGDPEGEPSEALARSLHERGQPAGTPVQDRSESMVRSVVLVANPRSGRGKRKLRRAREALAQEHLRVLETIGLDDLDRLTDWIGLPESERPLIVAGGGDGTIGTVAGHVVDTDAVLGILPLGTSNDVARSLTIPMRVEEAVHLLTTGEPARIDVGRFISSDHERHYFIHAAAMGINVTFARLATRPSFRKRLGPFTYAVAAVLALRHTRPFTCELCVDGQVIRHCLLHLSIVNAPVFGGVLGFQMPGAKVDDSRLDVLAIEDTHLPQLLLALVRVLFGRRWRTGGAELYQVSRLRVVAEAPTRVSLDGEIAGTIPGDFELAPRALRVMTPADFLTNER